MSKEEFKPDESHKQVSDLPESQRGNFVDLPDGGFVRKEAVDNFAQAESIVNSRNKYGDTKLSPPDQKETPVTVLMEEEGRRKHDLEYEKTSLLNEFSQKMGGIELKNASDELKADPEVVLAACETWGPAIQYASESLLQDKEFILKVFSKDRPFMHNLEASFYPGKNHPVLDRINKMHGLNITWNYD